MSTHSVSKFYPKPLNHNRFCRNGQVPSGSFIAQVAQGINHTVAWRRKTIGRHYRPVAAIPAGAAGTTSAWHFHFRAGYGAKQLWAVLQHAPASASGTDPYGYMNVTISGGSTTASNELHTPPTGNSDVPENFGWGVLYADITGGTEYEVEVVFEDYFRGKSIMLFEVGDHPVDTSNGGTVDPRTGVGVNILDASQEDYHQAQTDLITYNRTHFLAWTRDAVGTAPSITGATPTNIIDRSSTGNASATSPGFQFDGTYLAELGQTTVTIKVWVRAEQTTAGSGSVQLVDTAGTVLASISSITTAGWYSTTANITAGDTKFDIQARTLLGGQTIRVDAVSAYVDG